MAYSKVALIPALVLVLSGIERLAHAHFGPEPDVSQLLDQHAFRLLSKRSVMDCLDNTESRHLQKRAVERRQDLFESLREEHVRSARDTAKVLATNHRLNENSNPFGGKVSCSMTPIIEVGPYWVDGELIRKDIRETQKGVTVYLDIQVIDTKTCKPLPNVFVDIWHANATGVYGGVVAKDNGNAADLKNINTTFLRGLQPTNNEGITQFITIVPGHYPGRTNHIHTIVHLNGTVLPNNTYAGGRIPHIGNILFDQALLTTVHATKAYQQNNVPITLNSQDLTFAAESASASDPVMNYALLGSTVEDGLLGWVTLGVDSTADQGALASARNIWTAQGSLDNPNFTGGLPDWAKDLVSPPSVMKPGASTKSASTAKPTSGTKPFSGLKPPANINVLLQNNGDKPPKPITKF
ncbi:uncharacterized protein LOC129596795 [Paramacrobiotus metropolitanus]|uniref:uncharacterized protein LOC129596795 n=1 Tax=Paramacrobiotus metropolitanus TaxID=2943436 RepID=UPI0024458F47|nr:uncharacterized protein LOC129596795 [Paramacrobiotus metropolitanus]XP_055350137.1 uncharacterized protein LOC129596795 [Paramacrobiotus metropolitanus]